MIISIGSDHAGFRLKEQLKVFLQNKGYQVADRGCQTEEPSDYPDFAHAVADDLVKGRSAFGILICGSANGVAMAANKHRGIRAAVCWNEEIARLARQHNDANIICIPARFVSAGLAEAMTDIFLSAVFEGGRHKPRVEKING